MNENLYALLAGHFPAVADAPCLILPNGRRVSYAEMESHRWSPPVCQAFTR